MLQYRNLKKEIKEDLEEIAKQRALLVEQADKNTRLFNNQKAELERKRQELLTEIQDRDDEIKQQQDHHQKEMEDKIHEFNCMNIEYSENRSSLEVFTKRQKDIIDQKRKDCELAIHSAQNSVA